MIHVLANWIDEVIDVRRMNGRLLSPKVLLGDQPVNCICVCMVDDEKGSFLNL